MTPDATLPSQSSPYRPRVLLAEDDGEMRRLLTEVLCDDGYDVIAVGSGLQLFDELRRTRASTVPPAMVISDIRMPGLTGIDVLAAVRGWGWTLPIVLITAFGDEETLGDADELGATAIFSKPFEMDDLRTAVMHFLPRSGQPRSGQRRSSTGPQRPGSPRFR